MRIYLSDSLSLLLPVISTSKILIKMNSISKLNSYNFLYLLLVFIFTISCTGVKKKEDRDPLLKTEKNRAEEIRHQLFNAESDSVLVIAHRGNWRDAPENSIPAIKQAIEIGVDIVEIDLQKTKDGKLILMHDKSINRTTDGEGKIADITLDSLKTFHLKNGMGRTVDHRIPTLQEAMQASKNKVLVNLDKSYDYFDQVDSILKETGTKNQVIVKGGKPWHQVKEEFSQYLDEIIFMPIVHLQDSDVEKIIDEYLEEYQPAAIEFVFKNEKSPVLDKFKKIRKKGSRVWVNSLWASLNAGYEDEMAVKHTDSIYGWYVKKGVNMIQTDRPRLLLKYLQKKQLHQ